MISLKRPTKPDGFDADSQANLAEVRQQVNSGKKPVFKDSFWGKYKKHFMIAQKRRCGYCEGAVITAYGDMEHYRPKSTVKFLKNPGREREGLNNVRGRNFGRLCEKGYWWLAYDWDNYLLSCQICNQPWKKALFPIREDRPPNQDASSKHPCENPNEGDVETPLLINPFDDTIQISNHLKFTKEGLVKPTTDDDDIGKATIETCGLDRDSLNEKRSSQARLIYKLIVQFITSDEGSPGEINSLDTLKELGGEDSAIFPGVCRIMIENFTDGDYTWEDVIAYNS